MGFEEGEFGLVPLVGYLELAYEGGVELGDWMGGDGGLLPRGEGVVLGGVT